MPINRHSILVYGDSGEGKSTLALSVVKYVAKEFKKRTRFVLGDFQQGGGVRDLLNDQIAEVWDLTRREHPFEAAQFAALGYWPADVDDPTAKLLAPTAATWEAVGGYVFDSITGTANLLMTNMANRGAKGEKIGQDAPIAFRDGAVTVGGNPPAHYGVAQRRMVDFVNKTKELGVNGKQIFPMISYFTAAEVKGEDKTEGSKTMVIGPEVAGKAITATYLRNFECVFNIISSKGRDKDWGRLYLRSWFNGLDPVPHLAKSSLPALVYDGTPEFIIIPKPVPKDRHWGIGEYLEMLERMQEQAKL